jgi:hypothetical protein
MKSFSIILLLLAFAASVNAQDRTKPMTLSYENLRIQKPDNSYKDYTIKTTLSLWQVDTDYVNLCFSKPQEVCTRFTYFVNFPGKMDYVNNYTLFSFMAVDNEKQEAYFFTINQKSLQIKFPDKSYWLFH